MAVEVREAQLADWPGIAMLRDKARLSPLFGAANRPAADTSVLKELLSGHLVHVLLDGAKLVGFCTHYIPLASEPSSAELHYFVVDYDDAQRMKLAARLAYTAYSDLADMGIAVTRREVDWLSLTATREFMQEFVPIATTIALGTNLETNRVEMYSLEFRVADVVKAIGQWLS